MRTYLRSIPLLLLVSATACGDPVDESLHGGPQIPDSANISQDSLPNPEVPAVLEEPRAP